jgi:starch phosphorylase
MVEAVAHDVPGMPPLLCLTLVPGYGNKTTNNLRLWSAKPTREFDLEKFNSGDYESSVREQQRAETISAVLYPNDNIDVGKGTHSTPTP